LGPVYNRYSHQVTVDTLVLGDATAKYIWLTSPNIFDWLSQIPILGQ
jgi:hypothetical protein